MIVAAASGFISRNNDDETAKNMFEVLAELAIPRRDTLIWNIVPWYKEGDVTENEIERGASKMGELFQLLPKLKVVVAVGDKAWEGTQLIQFPRNVARQRSPHPSPQVLNPYPEKRNEIRTKWKTSYELSKRPQGVDS